MPFITEEIWLKVAPLAGKTGDTIMLQPYPVADGSKIDDSAMSEMEWLQSFVVAVRNIRGEMNIAPKQDVTVAVYDADSDQVRILQENRASLTSVAKISRVDFTSNETTVTGAASALVANTKIMVPLGDLIDKEAEIQRLQKELQRRSKDRDRAEAKLNNPQFIDKAPEAVVDKERSRLAELELTLRKLNDQLQQVQSL